MKDLDAVVQALADRAAIADVLAQYFHGADSNQPARVRECFTEDAFAHYEGRQPVQGADAVVAQIALFRNLASGDCTISTHFMGNLRYIELQRDGAQTETHGFAFLVAPRRDVPGATEDTVNMRSMRYLDRWRREAAGWKICARRLTLDWSCAVPAAFARRFKDKVMAVPPAPGSPG